MGLPVFDQFTLLHFASGFTARLLQIPFMIWVLIHVIFELVENTDPGIRFIRKNNWWPGWKREADSAKNSQMDTLASIAGWLASDMF